MKNKDHWYDGLFYDKIIAPNQDTAYSHLKKIIEHNSNLLDAGCGTGRLGFQLHKRCSKVTGIDLSIKNISIAKKNLAGTKTDNLEFIHAGIEDYLENNPVKFDYAVMSYVIHEVPEEQRLNIIKILSEHSEKLILIDYYIPRPKNLWSALNEVVEFVAGNDHYKNFRSYVRNNGVQGLAKSAGLTIIKEIINSPSTGYIAVLQREKIID